MRASLTLSRRLGLAGSIDTGTVAAALAAVLLGAFLILGTGFAPMAAIHNATHDTRHAAAFPCH
jgi:cobalt transporter subunit CbtB